MGHLWRIAVHVDEPDPGHFFWVLMEEGDDASPWKELESAGEPYEMWLDALQAGVRVRSRRPAHVMLLLSQPASNSSHAKKPTASTRLSTLAGCRNKRQRP